MNCDAPWCEGTHVRDANSRAILRVSELAQSWPAPTVRVVTTPLSPSQAAFVAASGGDQARVAQLVAAGAHFDDALALDMAASIRGASFQSFSSLDTTAYIDAAVELLTSGFPASVLVTVRPTWWSAVRYAVRRSQWPPADVADVVSVFASADEPIMFLADFLDAAGTRERALAVYSVDPVPVPESLIVLLRDGFPLEDFAWTARVLGDRVVPDTWNLSRLAAVEDPALRRHALAIVTCVNVAPSFALEEASRVSDGHDIAVQLLLDGMTARDAAAAARALTHRPGPASSGRSR